MNDADHERQTICRQPGHGFGPGEGFPEIPLTAANAGTILNELTAQHEFQLACLRASPVGAHLLGFRQPDQLQLNVGVVDCAPPPEFFQANGTLVISIEKTEHTKFVVDLAPLSVHWAQGQLSASIQQRLPEWLDLAPDGTVVRLDDGRFIARDEGVWQILMAVPLDGPLDTTLLPASLQSQVFTPIRMAIGQPEAPSPNPFFESR